MDVSYPHTLVGEVRLYPAEWHQLHRLARAEGISAGALARCLITEGLRDRVGASVGGKVLHIDQAVSAPAPAPPGD